MLLFLTLGIWIFPFAEELALLAAGYLLHCGDVEWWLMIPVVSIGVFLGDIVLFWLGHRCSNSRPFRWLHRQRSAWVMEQVSLVFDRYDEGIALFGARFLPGVRFPVHMVVGASGMSVPTYVTISVLSIVIYVPLVVMLANRFGKEIADALHSLQHFGYATWIVVFLTTALWLPLRPWSGARSVVRHRRCVPLYDCRCLVHSTRNDRRKKAR